MSIKKFGIAGKLVLMTMTGVGVIFLSIVSYGYLSSVDVINEEFRQRIENLGSSTAEQIKRMPQIVEGLTIDLASTLKFLNPRPEEIPPLMEKLLEPHPEVSSLFVGYTPEALKLFGSDFRPFVFRDGKKFQSRNLSELMDCSVTDWYQLPFRLRKPVWTEPLYGGAGKGRVVVDFCIPFQDENYRYIATVGAAIELHYLTDLIAAMPINDGGYVFLITPNGTIVSHPDVNYIMKETIFSVAEESGDEELWELGKKMTNGEKGMGEYTDNTNGIKYLVHYRPIEGMGWSLGIVFPEKQVLSRLISLSRTQIILGLAGMLAMLGMSLFVARKISRPIRALTDATGVLASGDLDAPLPAPNGGDEIASLTRSFSSMRDSLLLHIKDLAASTAERERIASELNIARSIQMSLVPRTFPPFPERTDFDLYARLEPAREVGGDFYDFFMIDQDHLLLTVGDVSGKGVPAALFMAVTRSFMKAFSNGTAGPAALLSAVNNEIAKNNDTCMFVTLFCAIVDLRDGRVRYASGGHNTPWLLDSTGARLLSPVKGTLIGPLPGVFFGEAEITLGKGQGFFIYSDGVTEALNRGEELLGEEQVQNWLSELAPIMNSEQLIAEMRTRIALYANGAEQSDDITMLCFRYQEI